MRATSVCRGSHSNRGALIAPRPPPPRGSRDSGEVNQVMQRARAEVVPLPLVGALPACGTEHTVSPPGCCCNWGRELKVDPSSCTINHSWVKRMTHPSRVAWGIKT